MKNIIKTKRDTYLRTKSRFYQTGWLDAERNEPAQASTRENDEEFYQEYLDGYRSSMENQFNLESM
jgi:hypothetical protein